MFFVGDGRNGMHSVGFSLYDIALIMKENGAQYALNFDGGGSSEFLVKGQLFNWPSEGKERAISNAIGVFDKVKRSSLW
jgi:exopolysaccharide biosynthesis protein